METTDESIQAEQNPGLGEQRVDLGELLIAIKNAVERMSNQNTHRGVMVTAGSVIIHLVTENRRLNGALDAAIEDFNLAKMALEAAHLALKPTVTLT
jgi:hypothetical protein